MVKIGSRTGTRTGTRFSGPWPPMPSAPAHPSPARPPKRSSSGFAVIIEYLIEEHEARARVGKVAFFGDLSLALHVALCGPALSARPSPGAGGHRRRS